MLKKLLLIQLFQFLLTEPTSVPLKKFGTTTIFKRDDFTHPTDRTCATSKPRCLIAWDLHDVVLTKDSSSHTLNFISSGIYHYGPFSNLRYLRKIKSLKNHYDKERRKHGLPEYSWEELLYVLLRSPKAKERFYGEYILKCIRQDQYTLNPTVALIIHKLASHGHRHAVLSNIHFEGLAMHIDILLTAGTKTGLSPAQVEPLLEMLSNQATRVIPHPHNNWTHKPERSIYHEFLTKNISRHAPTSSTFTIFIDDKETNVRAAIEAGFDIAIVYGSPQELEQALIYLEILS